MKAAAPMTHPTTSGSASRSTRLEDPPLVTRPRPLCRRHLLSAPAPHAHGALEPRARQDRVDRHRGRARLARRGRGLDRRRHRRRAADRFPRGQHSRARALPPAGAGDRQGALCRRAGRRGVRRGSLCGGGRGRSRRRSRSRSCRSCSPPRPSPASSRPAATPRSTIIRQGYGDVDAVLRAAPIVVELELAIGRHSGVPLETRGAIGRYDASRDILELHGAAKVPHRIRELLSRMLALTPSSHPRARVACRRRLRHPRRALSRGRAGLRRRHAARPAGEMDRGPARASHRRQSFAPAAAPHPRRRSTAKAASSPSTTSTSTTRAPMCAPTPRASCT